jgi:hypothetical protein
VFLRISDMLTRLGLALWLLGLLALSWTLVNWLMLAFSDWEPEWAFALLPIPPFVLLVVGTWPAARWLWFRRTAFYLGAVWWIWAVLSVVYGMFNAAFSLTVLIGGGAGLILLSMFAPRRVRQTSATTTS